MIGRSALRAEFLVRTIAERRIGGVLALAPPDGGFFGDFEFHGLETGAFVGAVAKRLMGRPAAGTPPVGSGFDFESEGFGIADFGFLCHGWNLPKATPDATEKRGLTAFSRNFPEWYRVPGWSLICRFFELRRQPATGRPPRRVGHFPRPRQGRSAPEPARLPRRGAGSGIVSAIPHGRTSPPTTRRGAGRNRRRNF